MQSWIFWNRRSGFDRRVYDEHPYRESRDDERRDPDSDNYVLVVGEGGIDRFTLLVALPLLALILILMFSTVPIF
jgi:hypothetical protein